MRWVALASAALALCAGCGGSGGGGGDAATVFAASSLTDVFERIDPDARFNFAGSDELATQLREGAEADVYASASVPLALELHREGVVEQPRLLAANQVVVVVPHDNPAQIASLADLGAPGVRIVIADEGVPAGDYARAALARRDEGTAILANVVSEERDVRAVVAKVALGEADAGFAYRTDLAAYEGDAVEVRSIGALARAEYAVAIVRDGDRAAAERFVEGAFGREGRRALGRAGFVTPSETGQELP
jgi:molybdate transport system substrate-binding protein